MHVADCKAPLLEIGGIICGHLRRSGVNQRERPTVFLMQLSPAPFVACLNSGALERSEGIAWNPCRIS